LTFLKNKNKSGQFEKATFAFFEKRCSYSNYNGVANLKIILWH